MLENKTSNNWRPTNILGWGGGLIFITIVSSVMGIIFKTENIEKVKESIFITSRFKKSKKKEQKYRCFEVWIMIKMPL